MNASAASLSERRAIVRDALRDVGYEDAHVQFDWQVSDRDALLRWATDNDSQSLPRGTATRLDVVAFYDERERNWDTTAFVAELDRVDLVEKKESGKSRARQLFELTAAPCALLAGNGKADLWLKCWQQPELVGDIQFSRESLRGEFRRHRQDLEREALARLRGGQRYLFDAVYHARRDELVQFLHRGLSKATWLAPELSTKQRDKHEEKEVEKDRKVLSRIAIALLAARILEDQGFFGSPGQSTDARQLLQNAEHAANGFFQNVISGDLARLDGRLRVPLVNDMLQCLMAHLTGPASFSLVTPEMLGYLYETALLAERKRGHELELNGIHYTPRSLAQHILDRIPLEELRPSERLVLDMACGSGSFLLSATERLREVFDARELDAASDLLEHLRTHTIGNDTDPIAILVTRLAYLVEHWVRTHERSEVPEPTRLWYQDALSLSPTHFADCRPSIIVGNPPFGAVGHGQQEASRFLLKSLELLAPGGFLGIVMPGSFLKMRRQKAGEVRRRLLDDCELLEVWEQPLGVVGLTARQETCVIIAQKRGGPSKAGRPVLFKATYSSRRSAVRLLREDLRSTWTFFATGLAGQPNRPWNDDEDSRIIASPIDCLWLKLDLDRTIRDLCVTGTGIDAPLKTATFSRRSLAGFVPYLRTQKRLRPYFLLTQDWQDDPDPDHKYVDPNTGHRVKRPLWPMYEGPKVIVRCDTNRNSKVQVAAAFDGAGVFPDHHFRCLALRTQSGDNEDWVNDLLAKAPTRDMLLWLTAILNGPVAHAWVAACSPPRGLLEIVLNSLPVPARFDPDVPRLVEQTSGLERTVTEDTPLWEARPGRAQSEYLSLAAEINQRVLSSYGLGKRDVELLDKFLRGMTEPWVDAPEEAHLPLRQTTYRRITGKVVAIDVKRQQVTLDLPRYSRKAGGPVTVPLPKHMPGWALRAGVEFTCLAPANRREPADLQNPWLLREFRPLRYPYLEPETIERMAGYRVAKVNA